MELVDGDKRQRHGLTGMPMPRLGVFGDHDVALGNHEPEVVLVHGYRFESQPESGHDLKRPFGDVVGR
jgi:hypothetical protein